MNRDFNLNPPESVSVEVYDWASDSNGNPTAHFLVMWSNGKKGQDYEGGSYATKQRQQTGYNVTGVETPLNFLDTFFKGTRWKLDPDTLHGDRNANRSTFTASRDHESEPVPVIFRAVRSGDHTGTVDAFFPTLAGSNDPRTCTLYSHVGQHCEGSRDYYRATRPATPEEVAPLRKELESIGYILDVRKVWTPAFDEIRTARMES